MVCNWPTGQTLDLPGLDELSNTLNCRIFLCSEWPDPCLCSRTEGGGGLL